MFLILPRPLSEAVEDDDDDVRRPDRDSGPIIRRVPPRLFLPLTVTSSSSLSPSQAPHPLTPIPSLLRHTSNTCTRCV